MNIIKTPLFSIWSRTGKNIFSI